MPSSKNAQPKAKVKPKAKSKAVVVSSSESGSESEVDEPKLTVPKKKLNGEQEKFGNWKRSINVWRSKYPSQGQKMLGPNLMECISGDAEDTIFANLEPGAETYDAIMPMLERAHYCSPTKIVNTQINRILHHGRSWYCSWFGESGEQGKK